MNLTITLPRNTYLLTISRRYCGAIAKDRKPRPGETWLRGSDLMDGSLRDLPAILMDLFRHERRSAFNGRADP